jgi:type IV secretory pathway TrbD component
MSDGQLPPGYVVRMHRSLTEPLLVAGVPRNVAILIGMLAAVAIGAWHLVLLTPVFVLTYLAAYWACRRDPYAIDVFQQNRGPSRYEP